MLYLQHFFFKDLILSKATDKGIGNSAIRGISNASLGK